MIRAMSRLLLALFVAGCVQAGTIPSGPMPWTATSIGECGLLEPPIAVPAAREIAPPAPIRLEAGTVEPLSLRLNIPAYRLEVVKGGRIVREIQVAVGTPDHPTPIGDFQVTSLVWNPWWIPPPFDWAKDDKATPPGPSNPTGRVKLFFGYYLFLHGTPDEASLGQAASHGCVRMGNADVIALARTVHAHASPDLSPAVLDTLEAYPRRTRSIGLETPVPFSIRYDLVEVRGGRIEIHADVYGNREAGAADVLAALEGAGIAPEDVDADELRAALRDPPPLEIPLSGVLRRDR